jgi:hypothetical protein
VALYAADKIRFTVASSAFASSRTARYRLATLLADFEILGVIDGAACVVAPIEGDHLVLIGEYV